MTADRRTAALSDLEPLVGTWDVETDGEPRGQVRFEWRAGRTELVQHVALTLGEDPTEGTEVIGLDPARGVLASTYVGRGEAAPLHYTWEVTPTTLTIWFGDVGSPARYRGTFAADGRSNVGAWEWPGGGYRSSMHRAD